jgi:hypothetical protein
MVHGHKCHLPPCKSDPLSSQQVQFRADGRRNLAGSVLINKSAGVQWQFRQMYFSSEVGHGGCVGNRMAESGAACAKYAHNKALSTGSVRPGPQHFCDCVSCPTSARKASRQVEELTVHVDEIVRNMQSTPQEVEGDRLHSLRVRMGMAGCLIACNCRNQRVLLRELPPDRRAGHTWAVRNLRLRCCNASASLSPDLFDGGRLLGSGRRSSA